MTRSRRGLLALLLAIAALAVSISYTPLAQVTRQAEASTSLTIHEDYGTPTSYGQCEYGATALAIGRHQLHATGFYNRCNPSLSIGMCVRLSRLPTPLTPGESQLTLIGQRCLPQATGNTARVVPAFTVACQTGRSYQLYVAFYVYADSYGQTNSVLACL